MCALQSRLLLTHRLVLLTVAIALGCSPLATAEPFPADPVEALRRELRSPPDPLTPEVMKKLEGVTDVKKRDEIIEQERERQFKDLITRRVDSIKSISDLRQAMSLLELSQIGSTLSDTPDLSDLPRRIRPLLVQRFRKEAQRILKSGDTASRLGVLSMISEVGTSVRTQEERNGIGRGFTDDLAALVEKDPNPAVRHAAARTLGQTFPDAKKAAAALGGLLRSGTPEDKRAAAEGLLGIVATALNLSSGGGQTASRVVADKDELVNAALAVLPEVAHGVGEADRKTRQFSAAAIQAVTNVLYNQVPHPRRPDETVDPLEGRKNVFQSRKELQPLMTALREQGPALKKAAVDDDPEVRNRVRRAYEDMAASRQLFQQALADVEQPGEKGGDPLLEPLRSAVPVLAEGSLDHNVPAKIAAIEALEPLGPVAAPAVPSLLKAVRDSDKFVRWSALRTLGKIGPVPGADTVPALARELHDHDLSVALAAANALKEYGPAAKGAVPDLIQNLTTTDSDLRLASIYTLEGIGTDSRPAIPTLARLLDDPDARVRRTAAELLGRFGSVAKSAEADLRRALDDPNADVRKAASDALLNVLSGR
jgi:HEAT repeat protein